MNAIVLRRDWTINPRTGQPWTYDWTYFHAAGRRKSAPKQGVLRLDPALKPPRKAIRR